MSRRWRPCWSRTGSSELLIATLRREHRSTRSERIDPAQLSLLLEALLDHEGAPAAIDPEAEARADAELAAEIRRAAQAQARPPRKPRKTGPGWQTRGAERQEHHARGAGRGADVRGVRPGEAQDRRRPHARARVRARALRGARVPPRQVRVWALQGGRDHGPGAGQSAGPQRRATPPCSRTSWSASTPTTHPCTG